MFLIQILILVVIAIAGLILWAVAKIPIFVRLIVSPTILFTTLAIIATWNYIKTGENPT